MSDQRLHDQLSTATPRVIDSAITRPSPYGTLAEPTYSGITSFLRRPYRKDLRDTDVAVFGAPFDLATTNRPGARLGPRAIRSASASLAWCPPYRWGFDPLDRLSVVDFGDLYFDPGRPADIPQGLYEQVRDILSHDVLPLALGGDHFVSFPILRALSERHGPISLIHFDAHSDTWRDEDDRIDHGTMFFHAARLGYVDPSTSIQLGMRTFNEETHGFQVCDAEWLHAQGIDRALHAIHSRVGQRPCYVSFDIDFLDPAFAPGTGTPVCGGFSTHEALRMVRGLASLNVIGMDVVEVAPAYDHAEITALAAASIAHELLAVVASRRPCRHDD